ncbi:MAG: sugar kinase [Conexibacter sp.]|nr:sugar kinase [Conexibacter sp.]
MPGDPGTEPPPLDVVTFGEALGLFLTSDANPLRGAQRFVRQVAGAELNVAVALARLGHGVGWFGRVGADAAGEEIVATLRRERVDSSHVVIDPERATGLLVRDWHPERRVRVDYHRRDSAGSALCTTDLDVAYLTGARILHVTGITPALSRSALDATRRALDEARRAGVLTVLDPNVRLKLWSAEAARETLAELAELADIVLTGADEAALLSGREGRDAAAWFLERGAHTVVVKEGAAGAWATDGEHLARVAPRPVTAVDPVGAGDAFDAGFLSGWLSGEGLDGCLTLGAALGAACVQVRGDLDGLPSRAEVQAMLDDVMEADR